MLVGCHYYSIWHIDRSRVLIVLQWYYNIRILGTEKKIYTMRSKTFTLPKRKENLNVIIHDLPGHNFLIYSYTTYSPLP